MAQTLACYNHPTIPATATCADCGAGICAVCICTLRGQPFCPADYAIMRREGPDAHLSAEVPPYEPRQYHYQLPVLEAESSVINVPLPSGSLFGSGLVSSIPPALVVQPHGPADRITKWAWAGIVCPLLIVVSIFGSIVFHWYLPGWATTPLLYSIPGLAAIGVLINIITLLLLRRSTRPDTVGLLGCFGIILNGTILGLTILLFEFAMNFHGLASLWNNRSEPDGADPNLL